MQSFPRFITKFKFLQFSGIPELLPPKEFHLLDHNVLESILFQTVPIPKPPLLQGSHGVHNFLRKCFLEPGFKNRCRPIITCGARVAWSNPKGRVFS